MISKELLLDLVKCFPDDVEGEDLPDSIALDMVLLSPVWMDVAAANPEKPVEVRMTYKQLMCIYRRMAGPV